MNKIVNKILLAGGKFMPEIHLKQPAFTYSACGPFTKNKERIQQFKETGDTSYIYKNELDKACFQHDITYGDFKDLKKRTASDKILRDKVFNIVKNLKYDGYQRGLASLVYKFFDKKSAGGGIVNNNNNNIENNNNNNEIKQNPLDLAALQLAEELHKPITRKFKKRKVYSGFRDKICGADLADMQLISKFNGGFRFLLCIIDIFGKYAWVVPLKDKKGISIVNALQKILKESECKINRIWVDKGSEFYNNSFKKWLKDNDIKMYSIYTIYNEGKSVVAERFIRTLKNKIYKYMTAISKNVYIDKLDDIVDKHNNTYHRTIKMKPVDVKDNTYIDFEKEINNKDPKFKIGDHVRISKYKNIFAKRYIPNWSEEVFIISKIKNTVPWSYIINDLNGEEIIGTFYEK